MPKRLDEITAAPHPVRVDRESGVIRGVKLLGTESKNGRRYPREVILAAASKYEGIKAYINHPARGTDSFERRYEDWAGRYQNVRGETREGEFGLYADLKLRKGSGHYESLLSDAEDDDFARDFGISHVAMCESEVDGDCETITEIVEPLSGDIVTDPATNAGLFESHERTMPADTKPKTVKKTLAEIRGRQSADTAVGKLLMEMDEAMAPMETEIAVEPEASAESMGKSALRDLVVAAFEDESLDMAATIARIKAILKLDADMKGEAGGESEEPAEEPTEESRRLREAEAKLARMEAKTLLLESGREATDIRIRTLAATDERDRKPLLESWPKRDAGAGRPETSGGVIRESIRYEDDLDDEISDADVAEYEKRLAEAVGR